MSGMIMRGVEKIFNSDNMRTNLELWLIVEQNFDILFDGCICDILLDLKDDKLISDEEYQHLKSIMQEYGLKRGFLRNKEQNGVYFWKAYHKKPRKKFIHRQILKAIRNE